MRIQGIELNEFRVFKKSTKVTLAKNITAISGVNGVGKSTILAALVNSSQLDDAPVKPLVGGNFGGRFEQLVTYDSTFDTAGSDRVKIKYSDVREGNTDIPSSHSISFRSMRQKAPKRELYRYRLIPQKIDSERETEAKVHWPVLYSGLSRLFPLGESDRVTIDKIDPEISKKISKIHKRLMFENFDLNKSTINYLTPDTKLGTQFAGINTEQYSATSNSSGQDNLTHILLAVESFELLKNELGGEYDGGMLAIDELDATLHPSVQFSLFNYLEQKSIELDLQIVFTTHSITLLEYITNFIETGKAINDKVVFIDRKPSTNEPDVIDNPTKEYFNNNLSRTISNALQSKENIRVLTEDAVARNFLQKIIAKSGKPQLQKLHLLDVSISWSSILNLVNSDYKYFSKLITILDPDTPKLLPHDKEAGDGRIYSQIINDPKKSSLLILPGTSAIEKMVWEYIENSKGTSILDDFYLREKGYTFEVLTDKDHSPQFEYPKEDREQEKTVIYKNWHNQNPEIYDTFLDLWIDNNQPTVFEFVGKLTALQDIIQNKLQN
ncbi:ATP-dependent nuclease [Leuconostoc citreum]|uniref:ATP-dependent nuclease n=1 Tax=Leuconostoc citreum TaxID=33964 RepID=UPI0015DA1FD5|nr:AAA family ATPase [Leuconostoc citreum]